ncbi:MAG: site-2 protease family protein [Planctomycetaceae bacterium]|nr:site-2 protease family protein [Planctomycetaceae bacterium]
MENGIRVQEAILWYTVFVVSIVCHEAAHAFAAFYFGDRTAHEHGLVTLNPIPHIQRSPIGMVAVPLLSFIANGWMIGWASTPYDPYWQRAYPKKAALMGLAGPATNLLLAVLAGVLIRLGMAIGAFTPELSGFTSIVQGVNGGLANGIAMLLSILFSLNLLLCVFNLIPITPLDGTALAEFILRGQLLQTYRAAMQHPTVQIFGLFAAWYIIGAIYAPIYLFALRVLFVGFFN